VKKMEDREFRSMAEYLEACKPAPKKPKGNKYYVLGVLAAEEAIRKFEEQRRASIAQW
jgi:hypothetical protein